MISIDPPHSLNPRILSDTDRERLKAACLDELFQGRSEGWNVQGTLQVIDEFARFCWLLSQPENFIYTQSGQYTQKLVPSRSVDDMAHEMRQELINLPPHTAYARVQQEQAGEQRILLRKIHTLPPLPEPTEDHSFVEHAALERTHTLYCRERDRIDDELRSRYETWRKAKAERARQRANKWGATMRPAATDSEEPPSTHS